MADLAMIVQFQNLIIAGMAAVIATAVGIWKLFTDQLGRRMNNKEIQITFGLTFISIPVLFLILLATMNQPGPEINQTTLTFLVSVTTLMILRMLTNSLPKAYTCVPRMEYGKKLDFTSWPLLINLVSFIMGMILVYLGAQTMLASIPASDLPKIVVAFGVVTGTTLFDFLLLIKGMARTFERQRIRVSLKNGRKEQLEGEALPSESGFIGVLTEENEEIHVSKAEISQIEYLGD